MNNQQARAALAAMKKVITDGSRVRLLETLTLIVRRMQIYPPPPPRSKYARTYRFKNAWRITETLDGFIVRNAVRNPRGRLYPVYVVGDAEGEGQAEVHVGRWMPFRKITEDALKRLPLALIRDLQLTTERQI